MIRILLVCFVLILSLEGARAQDLPALFAVSGVSALDVLPIRTHPDAASDIAGSIAPFTIGVEVVAISDDGAWGMVSTGEGNGWVAMRFLQATPPPKLGLIPRPLTCLGIEPFWQLRLDGIATATYATPDADMTMTIAEEVVTREGYFLRISGSMGHDRTLIIRRAACSDGMSDRQFGFALTMFSSLSGTQRINTGCCTLDSR